MGNIDLIENERGERLRAVRAIDEAAAAALPLAFSLVLGRSDAGYLLVYNRHRAVWELPGGFIDAGESARQCAIRELEEESGQRVTGLRWRAVLEIERPTGTIHGALYCADIATVAPFAGSAETACAGFWPASGLPAGTSNIDRALIAYYA